MKFTVQELAALFNARLLIHEDISDPLEIVLKTDSRLIKPGDIFLAMRGETQDGHQYIHQAIENGAMGIVAEKPAQPPFPHFELIVPSTQQALLSAGEKALQETHCQFIGITGSAGKTTVKEMMASVLKTSYRTAKTTGNYNTPIGVPISIFAMDPAADFFTIELSASYPGEIDQNLRYLHFSDAVISSIGPSHIEFFHTVDRVLQEKMKIKEALLPQGTLCLPGDNQLIQSLPASQQTLYFGFGASNPIRAVNLVYQSDGMHFQANLPGESIPDLSVPSFGDHMILNALPVIFLARKHGVSVPRIRESLSGFSAPAGRGKINQYPKGFCVIDETYNANPVSFKAALSAFSNIPFKRKILVFSDMLELGTSSRSLHQALAKQISSLSIDQILYYGDFNDILEPILQTTSRSYHYFPSLEALEKAFFELVQPGDGVLMKASNGKALFRIIQHLKELA